MKNLLFASFFLISVSAFSQVGIKEDNSAPIGSAQLEVSSTSKAFYPPRMTNAQVKAIASPQKGAMVYDTDLDCVSLYNGTSWICTGSGGSTGSDANGGTVGGIPGSFQLGKINSDDAETVSFYESAIDNSTGRFYLVGSYTSPAQTLLYNIDGSVARTFPAAAGNDVCIAAFSPDGAVLWTARLAGGGIEFATGVAADAGGIAVSGFTASLPMTVYNGKVNDAATETSWGTLGSGGLGDAFLIRFNTSGAVQWVARQFAPQAFYNPGVSSDGTSVYMCASSASAQINVYNARTTNAAAEGLWGVTPAATTGAISGTVTKYSIATGAVTWVARTEASGLYANDISVSGTALYLSYDGNALFQPYYARTTAAAAETGWGVTPSIGNTDTYLVRYSPTSGSVTWVARLAGGDAEYSTKITTDALGAVTVIGGSSTSEGSLFTIRNARNTVGSTETSWGTLRADLSNGNFQFVAKYNSTGSVVWAAKVQGNSASPSTFVSFNDVSTDRFGNVYVCGYHRNINADIFNGRAVSTDGESVFRTLPTAINRGFMIKYTNGGKVEWANKLSSLNNTAINYYETVSTYHPSIAVLPILVGAGSYNKKLTLGNGFVNSNSTNHDGFYFKYVPVD